MEDLPLSKTVTLVPEFAVKNLPCMGYSDDIYQSIYWCGIFFFLPVKSRKKTKTERGGSVVTHETRIREVPGSNPVTRQPG